MTLSFNNSLAVLSTQNNTILLDCTSTPVNYGPRAVEILPLEYNLEVVLTNKELLTLDDSTSL